MSASLRTTIIHQYYSSVLFINTLGCQPKLGILLCNKAVLNRFLTMSVNIVIKWLVPSIVKLKVKIAIGLVSKHAALKFVKTNE